MITFRKENNKLIFSYSPNNDIRWVHKNLKTDGYSGFRRVFIFQKEDLYSEEATYIDDDIFYEGETVEFIFGYLDGEYYKVNGAVFGIKQDLYLHKDLPVEVEMFIASKNISIIGKMSKLIEGDIYIGGNDDNCLPAEEMQRLIKSFPNDYEM